MQCAGTSHYSRSTPFRLEISSFLEARHSSFSIIRNSLSNPDRIDAQCLGPIECQCWQDSAKIWPKITNNRKKNWIMWTSWWKKTRPLHFVYEVMQRHKVLQGSYVKEIIPRNDRLKTVTCCHAFLWCAARRSTRTLYICTHFEVAGQIDW